jgi:hypothetical protein
MLITSANSHNRISDTNDKYVNPLLDLVLGSVQDD